MRAQPRARQLFYLRACAIRAGVRALGPDALGDSTGTLAGESVIFAKQRAPLQFLCWNQLIRLGDEAEPTVGSLGCVRNAFTAAFKALWNGEKLVKTQLKSS